MSYFYGQQSGQNKKTVSILYSLSHSTCEAAAPNLPKGVLLLKALLEACAADEL